MKLLRAPILNPKFQDWTTYILRGLCEAAKYHKYRLTQKLLEGDNENLFPEFAKVLDRLVDDLNGGYKKRCLEAKAASVVNKHKKDLEVIKQINLDKIQKGLAKAYIVAVQVAEKYKGCDQFPGKARRLLNSIVAGANAFTTILRDTVFVFCKDYKK